MVILCADCANSLLLAERIAELSDRGTPETGETIEVMLECMECGKEFTAKMSIFSVLDRPAIWKLRLKKGYPELE